MSMSDSTQLSDYLITHTAITINAPMVKVDLTDQGRVHVTFGTTVLSLSAADAATLAASLATVASTALVNNVIKLVTE